METINNDNYLSNKEWLRNALISEKVVLRGISALEYLQLFPGYLTEKNIEVYALSEGQYSNVQYYLVDSFDEIDYFDDGFVLCATLEQVIKDYIKDYDTADTHVLVEALGNYYCYNNDSFDNLMVDTDQDLFNEVKEWAIGFSQGVNYEQ